MSKEITLTLRLMLEDLPEHEIREQAALCGMEPDEFTDGVKEVRPHGLGNLICNALTADEMQQEYIWAGSDLYARIASAEIVSAA